MAEEENNEDCCGSGECCESDTSSLNPVAETKTYRKHLDAVLQEIKGSPRKSRERSLAITKIQEGIMWLGMDLKAQNEPNPYPESKNPDSPAIEPTADGLTM